MSPIKINGIKLSQPLVQVTQSCTANGDLYPAHLYQLLAADRINIEFLNLSAVGRNWHLACCVAAEKLHQVKNYISRDSDTGQVFGHRNGVVTLSVYPHKASFDLFGRLLAAFGRQGFEFHQMASSTSMLTFVADAAAAEEMADFLARRADLPASHTPFRPNADYDPIARSLKTEPETVATYVESKIKTYGIRSRPAQTLCWIDVPFGETAQWGHQIRGLEQSGLRFSYVSAHRRSDRRFRMCMAIESVSNAAGDREVESLVRSVFDAPYASDFCFRAGAGGLHFQGPHFGDRFGIADQAFSTLRRHSVPMLLGGCVGASVNIVLDEDRISAAEAYLSEVFEIPG